MSKKTRMFTTNKERVIHELKQMGYDLKMTAEDAVANFTHKPDTRRSFDEAEKLSYFNDGAVKISLTGLDIIERDVVERELTNMAAEIQDDLHTCLKGVINEYTK